MNISRDKQITKDYREKLSYIQRGFECVRRVIRKNDPFQTFLIFQSTFGNLEKWPLSWD